MEADPGVLRVPGGIASGRVEPPAVGDMVADRNHPGGQSHGIFSFASSDLRVWFCAGASVALRRADDTHFIFSSRGSAASDREPLFPAHLWRQRRRLSWALAVRAAHPGSHADGGLHALGTSIRFNSSGHRSQRRNFGSHCVLRADFSPRAAGISVWFLLVLPLVLLAGMGRFGALVIVARCGTD